MPPPPPALPHPLLPLFELFFYFSAIVSSVTTTSDKFQFQSQVRLSQINVIVPMRLEFKLYAVFIEWSSGIDFLFMGQENVINYWDVPSKISRNCEKGSYRKLFHMINEKLWEMSLRERLICFADFVGMNLLAVLFLLPLPDCFFRVCLPIFFAVVLNFFLPVTTSAISGTANFNKSAPTRFAAGKVYLLELQFSQ